MKLLVTGAAGFIGSHCVRYWLAHYPNDTVIGLDVSTGVWTADDFDVLRKRFSGSFALVRADITDHRAVVAAFDEHRPDVVVNCAAESHNSRAIVDPRRLFQVNVVGTHTLLEASHRIGVQRFHHISTCEVYGDLPLDATGGFTEGARICPRNPYAASKAGADLAVQAYGETYNLPIVISRCSNNYGPFQIPEKVIPLFITNALDRRPLTLYEHSHYRREWLHVDDHCAAIDLMIHKGTTGEIYNIGSGVEKSVEDVADAVLSAVGLPGTMKTYVRDRPSHATRYRLDCSKVRHDLGWKPRIDFEKGLVATVRWYADNAAWWRASKAWETSQEGPWVKQPVAVANRPRAKETATGG